jgi:hypothetical protein
VGVTAGLMGVGGAGKTTLAASFARSQAAESLFPGGAVWITLSQTANGPGLVNKISDVSEELTGHRPSFSDAVRAVYLLADFLRVSLARLWCLTMSGAPRNYNPFSH